MCVIKIHAFTSIGRPPSWLGTMCFYSSSQVTFYENSFLPFRLRLSSYSLYVSYISTYLNKVKVKASDLSSLRPAGQTVVMQKWQYAMQAMQYMTMLFSAILKHTPHDERYISKNTVYYVCRSLQILDWRKWFILKWDERVCPVATVPRYRMNSIPLSLLVFIKQ